MSESFSNYFLFISISEKCASNPRNDLISSKSLYLQYLIFKETMTTPRVSQRGPRGWTWACQRYRPRTAPWTPQTLWLQIPPTPWQARSRPLSWPRPLWGQINSLGSSAPLGPGTLFNYWTLFLPALRRKHNFWPLTASIFSVALSGVWSNVEHKCYQFFRAFYIDFLDYMG